MDRARDAVPDGTPGDLDEIVRRFRPSVYRYCRAHLPDRETAEDVTQEVMMAVVRGLPALRGGDSRLRAYVFGIATRQVALSYRSAYRRRETPFDEVPDGAEPAAGPEALAELGETRSELVELLARLSDLQRQVVLLRVAAELSTEETGDVLGLSPGAVRVAQHRALIALRRHGDRARLT